MRPALGLITIACIVQVLGYFYALPGHLGEHTWSEHAQFHHVLGWLWLVGLNGAILALAWGPLRGGSRRSWWLVLALYGCAQGAHWLAKLLVPNDLRSDPLWYSYALIGMALVGLLGLVVAARALEIEPAPPLA